MQIVLRISLFLLCLAAISGCSRLQFPWVYRIHIQQGNYIEQEMVDQLEVGMTPEQVRYIMGNPLVTDTFHPDRWDYYFTFKRGEKLYKEYHFQVYFENGVLASWEGDYEPDKTSAKGDGSEDEVPSADNPPRDLQNPDA